MSQQPIPRSLGLRSGELVEVRSAEEILGTLGDDGCLDALPFMPEMLAHCGRRFRVYKRSDKTCDTIEKTGTRRMRHTVHLEDLRCDGAAHDGCKAACLLFWKESWLRRVGPGDAGGSAPARSPSTGTAERLHRFASRLEGDEKIFRCQATELRRATTPLAWWDPRQYWRDLRSGNASLGELLNALLYRAIANLLGMRGMRGYRLLIGFYNRLQRRRDGIPYPIISGRLRRTPKERLSLQPGERVQVKRLEQIVATLDGRNRNRGLLFDPEMTPYCGGTFTVRSRVDRIIDERTGRMLHFGNDCIILDGAVCRAWFSDRRIGCPRSIFPYWREIWLERVDDAEPKAPPAGQSPGRRKG